MNIIVLLSSILSFFELSFINLNPYFLNSKGDNNNTRFQKTNKTINK